MNEHSMDLDDLLGQPLDEVPIRSPDENCNGRRWEHRDEGDEVVFVGYCQNRAGKGTDHVGDGRCKFHGGAADNTGESNGNYCHGGFSESFPDDLSRSPREVVEELAAGADEPRHEHARLIAAVLLNQFRRSQDPRFLMRWEHYADTYGFWDEQEAQP